MTAASRTAAARRHSIATDEDKRRSERFNAVATDGDLREGKRLVHPRLPPPPAYWDDYEWDGRKKIAHYVGPTSCPKDRIRKNGSRISASARKRQRADDSDDSDSDDAGTRARQPATKKVVVSRVVELKKVRLGTRASPRHIKQPATNSARSNVFDRLRKVISAASGRKSASDDEDLTSVSGSDKEDAKMANDRSGQKNVPGSTVDRVRQFGGRTLRVLKDTVTVTTIKPPRQRRRASTSTLRHKKEESEKPEPIKADGKAMDDFPRSSPEDSSEEHQIEAMLRPVGSVAPESPLESMSTATPDTMPAMTTKKEEDASGTDTTTTHTANGTRSTSKSGSQRNSNQASRQNGSTSEGFGDAAGLKEGVRPAAKTKVTKTLTRGVVQDV